MFLTNRQMSAEDKHLPYINLGGGDRTSVGVSLKSVSTYYPSPYSSEYEDHGDDKQMLMINSRCVGLYFCYRQLKAKRTVLLFVYLVLIPFAAATMFSCKRSFTFGESPTFLMLLLHN